MGEDLTLQRVIEIIIESKNRASEGVAGAAGELEGLQATAFAVGEKMALVGAGMVALGGGIGAGLAGLVSVAADYQAKLVEIQNNTTMSDADVKQMHDSVLRLSEDTGSSTDKLAEGFMHITNLTGDASTATDILSVANESAVSTGDDVARVSNILANIMHEYGADVSTAATATQRHAEVSANAAHYMGVMHLAAAEANMTLSEFSANFGQVSAWAANTGVSVEEASAAFATLTKHGFDAAEAGTQVKNMLEHIIKPSAGSEKELKRLSQTTGVDLVNDFTAAGLHGKGLTGVLADLKLAYERAGYSQDQMTAETMKLIPNIRGGAGAFTLLGTGAKDYAAILADLNDKQKVDNITRESYIRTTQTLGFQVGRTKAQLHATAIVLGESMLPTATKVADVVQGLTERVRQWAEAHPQAVTQIAATAAVLLTLGGGVLIVTGLVTMALVPLAGFVLGLARVGIGAAGAAISVARFVGNLIIMGAQLAIAAARFVAMAAAEVVSTIATLGFGGALQYGLIYVGEFIARIPLMLGGFAAWAAGAVAAGAATVVALLPILVPLGLGIAAIAALYLAWNSNFLGIRDVVGQVVGFIVDQLGKVFGFLGDLGVKAGILDANWRQSWESMKSSVATSATGIQSTATTAFDKVKTGGLGSLGDLALGGVGHLQTLQGQGLTALTGLQGGGTDALGLLKTQGLGDLNALQTGSAAAFDAMNQVGTAQVDQLAVDHQKAIDALVQNHDAKVEDMKQQHMFKMAALAHDHDKQMTEVKTFDQKASDELKTYHSQKIEELHNYHDQKMRDLHDTHVTTVKSVQTTDQTTMAQLGQVHQTQMDQLVSGHDTSLGTMQQTTDQHMQGVQQSIQTSMDQSRALVISDAQAIAAAVNAIPTQHDIYIVTHHSDVSDGGSGTVSGSWGGGTATVPAMASGGIVSRPTLALIGEAGPEAVVPLGQMNNVAASLAAPSGGTKVVLQIESPHVYGNSLDDFAEALMETAYDKFQTILNVPH